MDKKKQPPQQPDTPWKNSWAAQEKEAEKIYSLPKWWGKPMILIPNLTPVTITTYAPSKKGTVPR